MRLLPLNALLLALPCTHSFLPSVPSLPLSIFHCRARNNRLSPRMSTPISEGSVDAQAMAIIAELQAGTKTM